jgi:D-alanyl-D-alanine carboxypeptidase
VTGWGRAAVVAVATAAVTLGAVSSPTDAVALPSPPTSVLHAGPMPAPPVGVTAESWIVIDTASGHVISAHDADVPRTVASAVKVLTALSVVERTERSDVVIVGDEVRGVAGALVGLSPGDEVTIAVLLDVLIARSGNDVAEALAVHVAGSRQAFVELMRADAAAVGVRGTVTSASGLDDTDALTAHDLAILGSVALAHPELRDVLSRREVTLPDGSVEESRNELLFTYPGATGVKTGYTRIAGNTLVASARRDGRELVAVVLGSDDDPGRFLDAAALLDHGFALTRQVLVAPVVERPVAGGRERFEAPPSTTTTRRTSQVHVWPDPVSTTASAVDVVVEVDGRLVGRLSAYDTGAHPPATSVDGEVGRALVDAVWQAARATALGTVVR